MSHLLDTLLTPQQRQQARLQDALDALDDHGPITTWMPLPESRDPFPFRVDTHPRAVWPDGLRRLFWEERATGKPDRDNPRNEADELDL